VDLRAGLDDMERKFLTQSSIIRIIKSRGMRWAELVAGMVDCLYNKAVSSSDYIPSINRIITLVNNVMVT
jgi:hypothetical protein